MSFALRRSVFRFSTARALLAVLALAALAVPNRSLAQTALPSGPPYQTISATGNSQSVAIGDMNGDGNKDVVIGVVPTSGDQTGRIQIVLGDGHGGFGTPREFATGPILNPGSVVLGDLNGDGKLDVAVVNRGDGSGKTVSVLFGDGAGNLGSPVIYDLNQTVSTLALGDVNGDGKRDLIATTNSMSGYTPTGGVWVLLNNGSGGFNVPTVPVWSRSMGYGMVPAADVAAGDLDGDGKCDIVVTSGYGLDSGWQGPVVTVLYGDGNGAFPSSVGRTFPDNGGGYPAAGLATGVAIADLDGDGQPDLVVPAADWAGVPWWAYAGAVTVFRNTGSRTFDSGTANGSPFRTAYVAVGDLNNDGHPDVVVTGAPVGESIAYLLNDGHGGLGAANYLYVPSIGALAVGDLTNSGPGTLDVIAGTFGSGTLLLRNGPAGPVAPTQTLTILGGSGAVGDIAQYVEYYNPVTGNWQPAYLTGWHPWGFVAGTNSWINYKPSSASDPGVSTDRLNPWWYLYRVRITVPADAQHPKMTFSVKADNWAQIAINGVSTGPAIEGAADQVNADAIFSQNLRSGENTITINVGDYGGLNGFNFRIDLSVESAQPLETVPTDATPPVITAPDNIVAEATSQNGAVVEFSATAIDNVDGPVGVVANPASGSTFPIATTTVGLTAADKAGNTATASFTVTVRDTTPPVITSVLGNLTVEATSAAGAQVGYAPAAATDVVGVASITYSKASGSTFPIGTTTVTVTAADAAGNSSSKTFQITVRDTTAPAITSVTPSQATLWPPNHQMVAINVNAVATDAVGVASLKIVKVTSSEPDNGLGDGDTAGDIVITGPLSLSLRAERAGNGNGRTYTITVEARDTAGNASTKTCTVFVPKSQGGK